MAVREDLPLLPGLAPETARPRPATPTAVAPGAAEASARATTGRFAALDLLRFLAVVLMVQGHTFREVLETAVRAERWHGYHNYIHGYTAPIFLFASGLAFGITTFRGWDKHLRLGSTLLKRLERYVLLLMIGYAMHMPVLRLAWLLRAEDAQLPEVIKVDALHNIGVMLLVAELSVVALRTQKRFVALMSGLGVVLVLAAPALWRLDVSGLPLFLAGYVNASNGSIFPLAPWGAFLVAGILTAYGLWDPRTRAVRPQIHVALLGLGLCTILLGDRLAHAGLDDLFGEHNFWKTSPWFFLIRLGVVWMVLGGLTWLSMRVPRLTEGRGAKLVQTLGQETLVIYVAHLFVLYGSPLGRGLAPMLGPTLSVAESSLLFAGIFAAMIAIALAWHAVKTRHPVAFHRVRRGVTLALLALFLFGGW